MKRILNKNGLTLIELVVASAILSLIIVAAASFYFYGMNSFSDGEALARTQRSVRLAEVILKEQLRTASTLSTSVPPAPYGILQVNAQTLKVSKDTAPFQALSMAEYIQSVSVSLQSVTGNYVLHYTITGVAAKQTYIVSGKIYLVNLTSSTIPTNTPVELNQQLLYYVKPL